MHLQISKSVRLLSILIAISAAGTAPNAFAQSGSAAQPATSAPPATTSPLLAHTVTAMVGQFYYDRGGDLPYPVANVRYTRALGRFAFGEAGLGYARVKLGASKSDGSDFRYIPTPILLTDVGIFAQLRVGAVAPFVGLTGSAFRRSGGGRRESVGGLGTGAAGGLRVRVSRALLLRAEFHVRADREGTLDLTNATQTVGLGYRY